MIWKFQMEKKFEKDAYVLLNKLAITKKLQFWRVGAFFILTKLDRNFL